MSSDPQVVNNKDEKRFELRIGDQIALIDYIYNKGKKVYHLTHTEVPQKLNGQGIGKKLVKQAFEIIEQEEAQIAPICPFIIDFLKRNREWQRLLTQEFRS